MIGAAVVATQALFAACAIAACAGVLPARVLVLVALGAAAIHVSTATRETAPAVARRERVATLTIALPTMVVLALMPPLLSDDLWRYLLDGDVLIAGFNPYAWAPASPKIADLAPELVGRVNNPGLPTIYPPAAQLLFGLNALLGGTSSGWRLGAIAALLTCGLLAQRACADPCHATAGVRRLDVFCEIVAHPLCVLAFASSGHLEVFAIAASVALIRAVSARRAAAAGWWLAIAGLLKLLPFALAATLPRLGARRAATACALATVVAVAFYAPFAGLGAGAFGSLGTYAGRWSFNAGPAALVEWGAEQALTFAGVPPTFEVPTLTRWREEHGQTRIVDGEPTHGAWVGRSEAAGMLARLVAALAMVSTAAAVAWRTTSVASATLAILLVALLFSPVVHPWYVAWMVVLGALTGSRAARAWGVTAIIAWWPAACVADGGTWSDPLWMRLFGYGVPLVIAIVHWHHQHDARRPIFDSA